jgi:hypothetical protein
VWEKSQEEKGRGIHSLCVGLPCEQEHEREEEVVVQAQGLDSSPSFSAGLKSHQFIYI